MCVEEEGGDRVNGRSGMSLMSLGVSPGSRVILEVDGPDAAQAVEVLAAILLTIPPEDQVARAHQPRPAN